MFCGNCGTKMEDGARFCPECGTAVPPEDILPEQPAAAEKAVEESKTEQPASPAFSPIPEDKPQKEKRKGKGSLIAAIVILLLLLIAAGVGIAFYFSPSQQYSRAMKKAETCMNEKSYLEAMELYEEALSLQETKEVEKAIVKAYVRYADECLKNADYKEAADNYQKALEYDDDSRSALTGLAAAYAGRGTEKLAAEEFEAAEAYFDDALSLDDSNEEAWEGKMNCMLGFGDQAAEGGNYEEALEYYDRVLYDWDYSNAAAFSGKAHVLARQGDVTGALALIGEGLSYNAEDSVLLEEKEYLIEHAVLTAKETVSYTGSYTREEYDGEGNLTKRLTFGDTGNLTGEWVFDGSEKLINAKYYDEKNGTLLIEEDLKYDSNGNNVWYRYEDYKYRVNSYWSELEYNSQGKLIRQASFDYMDLQQWQSIYEYDENNLLTLQATYTTVSRDRNDDPDYVDWISYAYTYDEYGNQLTEVCTSGYYYADGSDSGEEEIYSLSYEREYDEKGNEVYCGKWTDGIFDGEAWYEYDAKGNPIKSIRYDYYESGEISSTYEVENQYYEDGTLAYCREVWDSGAAGTGEAFYNEAGKVVKTVNSHDDVSITYTYTYDEHDMLVSESVTGHPSISDYVHEYVNRYDEFGNVVEQIDFNNRGVSYRYEYKLEE